MSKEFHLHLVSDSTGETVSSVSRAALAQFEEVEPVEHIWSLIRTKGQLEKMIEGLDSHPGVVMYTLVDKELRYMLRRACLSRSVPCIPILGPVIRELSNYLGEEITGTPGIQHGLTEDYFSKMEAINFALSHDDGQAHWELEEADIVIVGVSRTSKSPTCIYLANRGYKAANVPFVYNCPLPENLESLKNPLVVGLSIGEERLIQIRRSRLESLDQNADTNYVDNDEVKKEMNAARKLFRSNNWPVIDVTRRSIEETAALIIQYRQKQILRRKESA
ncbi:MAG: phosphoenolpyruvate synthase regulatory protein [Rickettsiales bacterium]|nr:phosphoenolpyruvate synthase regulatory protein [Rickettsiales bacterium]